MKQLKAFVHRNRIGDLIHALEDAGFRRLSLFDVKGLLRALSARELEYSVELGEKVISEVQIEVFCEDAEVSRAVEVIRQAGRTGHRDGGWIYVSAVEQGPVTGKLQWAAKLRVMPLIPQAKWRKLPRLHRASAAPIAAPVFPGAHRHARRALRPVRGVPSP